MSRILVFCALLFAAVVAPYWLCMIGGAICAFIYPMYIEYIILGGLLDTYYAVHALSVPMPWMVIIAFSVVSVAVFARQYLRIYDHNRL